MGEGSQHKQGAASILFTAFEPSGDAIAAPVIRVLREKLPNLRIYALGGPLMAEAGATMVESTVGDAAMGLSAAKRVFAVRRHVKAIKRWTKQYRVLAHVAVDSPAANFPIAKVMRKSGARVIHLVAPQLWAWGRWRVGKLRRSTDLVLCLLPFEEQWFSERGITARFIGHPRMNRNIDVEGLRQQMHGLPQGSPRVAIFPGSRAHEVRRNIKLLVDVYAELQGRNAGLAGVIVAARKELAQIVRKKAPVFPSGMHMTVAEVDPAIAWADVCLAVSGTITFDICRHQKPMIGVYKTGIISWLGSKLLLRTHYRLLPNIVAEREIVPEFVPYIGGAMPIVRQANRFLHDSKNQAICAEELARVNHRFVNKRPAEEAARFIYRVMKNGTVD